MAKKIFLIPAFLILLLLPEKLAQADNSVLPDTEMTYEDCKKLMAESEKVSLPPALLENQNFLACAIITGRVSLAMIPYFIVYLIQVLVKLSAILCVLFIVIGGLIYAISGITDQKEKAKKTVFNAVIGLVITVMAWTVINIIQVAVTSGGQ